jgi:hypothetical protein
MCTRCVRKKNVCTYDRGNGVMRQQDLRKRLTSVHKELAYH